MFPSQVHSAFPWELACERVLRIGLQSHEFDWQSKGLFFNETLCKFHVFI